MTVGMDGIVWERKRLNSSIIINSHGKSNFFRGWSEKNFGTMP